MAGRPAQHHTAPGCLQSSGREEGSACTLICNRPRQLLDGPSSSDNAISEFFDGTLASLEEKLRA